MRAPHYFSLFQSSSWSLSYFRVRPFKKKLEAALVAETAKFEELQKNMIALEKTKKALEQQQLEHKESPEAPRKEALISRLSCPKCVRRLESPRVLHRRGKTTCKRTTRSRRRLLRLMLQVRWRDEMREWGWEEGRRCGRDKERSDLTCLHSTLAGPRLGEEWIWSIWSSRSPTCNPLPKISTALHRRLNASVVLWKLIYRLDPLTHPLYRFRSLLFPVHSLLRTPIYIYICSLIIIL